MRQTHIPENLVLHQLLHGYAEGHRLLANSIEVPDNLLRLVLQLSDLSSSNVTTGFEEYITGYPLTSLKAYALAKTWYAAEMPRPGCVWTHTIVIPSEAMGSIPSLDFLLFLFKRPGRNVSRELYGRPIVLDGLPSIGPLPAIQDNMLQRIIAVHYRKENTPVIAGARDSTELESSVFALWSQQWPDLRMQFTFCTGALAMRNYGKAPFDVQCAPFSRAREVMLDTKAISSSGEAVIANSLENDLPQWSSTASDDAGQVGGGILRDFLWQVADENSKRSDFAIFVLLYEILQRSMPALDLISAIAKYFPEAHSGTKLKRVLFEGELHLRFLKYQEHDILLAFGTTPYYGSFDGEQLHLHKLIERLWRDEPEGASSLIAELFKATLNPLGEEILAALIAGMEPDAVRNTIGQHLQFLPALFHAKPSLAASAQLWIAAGDRKREMLEAVANHSDLSPSLITGIVLALLESNSEFLIRRALDVWGRTAVFALLDWSEIYTGALSESSREALGYHFASVMDWIQNQKRLPAPMLLVIAKVLGRYSSEIAKQDAGIWLRAFHDLELYGNNDRTYIGAFLLALALNNAQPDPLKLIAISFEEVHEAAWHERLSDDAWVVVEPFVPQLSWLSNWDKCERLRRGLILAFVRNAWPSSKLKECLRSNWLFDQVLRSASKIQEGKHFLRDFDY